MNAEERYNKILEYKQKHYLEIGFAIRDGYQEHYYICHSCKDGLFSTQDENHIVIKAIEHVAGEKHKIFLGDF